MEPLHCMRVAARRTGLTPDLIRVWERRYGAVTPARSQTRRRLYSEAEIARLQLLRDATRAGHGIGQIARLTEEELRGLLRAEERTLGEAEPASRGGSPPNAPDFVAAGMAAIRQLDAEGLQSRLSQAAARLGQWALLEQVLVPLIQQVGDLWQHGSLRMANEHLATAVIRTFLTVHTGACALPQSAPRLLVTTPPGQLHELGAILVAVAASNQGWRATYLGPSLPAEEIAGAALLHHARAVALSLVYPEDDPLLESELRRLRHLLPPDVALLVGGRAARAYRPLLENLAAIELHDLAALRSSLEALRRTKPPIPESFRPPAPDGAPFPAQPTAGSS